MALLILGLCYRGLPLLAIPMKHGIEIKSFVRGADEAGVGRRAVAAVLAAAPRPPLG